MLNSKSISRDWDPAKYQSSGFQKYRSIAMNTEDVQYQNFNITEHRKKIASRNLFSKLFTTLVHTTGV